MTLYCRYHVLEPAEWRCQSCQIDFCSICSPDPLEVSVKRSKKLLALMMNVKAIATRVIHLSPNVPDEAATLLAVDGSQVIPDRHE